MKKLATLLLVALLLPLVACADSLMSVSDLRAQVEASGGRWTQTYTNDKGEMISVDVALDVPDVESFPILQASWMLEMDESALQRFLAEYTDPTKEDFRYTRWQAYNDHYGLLVGYHDWDFTKSKDEFNSKKRIAWKDEYLPNDGLDWNRAYAFNNDLTLNEAFASMSQTIGKHYSDAGLPVYEPYLNYIVLENMLGNDMPVREKGGYGFVCNQAIRGIPVLWAEGQGCNAISPYIQMNIISQDSYNFSCSLYRETELLIDDIPLLSFESIKPVFEEMIRNGRLKDVLFLRLGYISIYENGKSDNETFRLLPCWVLTGEYYKSDKEEAEWKSADRSDDSILSSNGHIRQIIINAQTGKIIPQDASNSENHKLFNVKTW